MNQDTEALKALVAKWRNGPPELSEGARKIYCDYRRGCADELEVLVQRLLASPDANRQEPVAWLQIETAPKTGEHLLVAEFNPERIGFGFCGGKKQSMMTVAHWWDAPGEEGWYASVDSQGEYPFPATHWKPLNEL